VVEMPWPGGQPAQASWPHAPAGWRVVSSNQGGGWVLWRKALRVGARGPGHPVLTQLSGSAQDPLRHSPG
jgi:hypothetical protein